MSLRQWLPDPSGTVQLGAAIAHSCPWDLAGPRRVFLSGELGAGKTTLAGSILSALGITEPVRSPSYALLEVYELSAGTALHLDCYRLASGRELEQLGLRDYYRDRTLWLVEWPERGGDALPPAELAVRLEVSERGRWVAVEGEGEGGIVWLRQLEQRLGGQA